MYELMFRYREKPNRGEYIGWMLDVVPPATLLQELNQNLNLGLVAGGIGVNVLNFGNLIANLNTRINTNGDLLPRELRNAFRQIMLNASQRVINT